ncbi:MAG: beta-galactosidase [Armatimonadia bacterium]
MPIMRWLAVSACVLALGVVVADDLPADWTATVAESFDKTPYCVQTLPPDMLRASFSRFALTPEKGARVAGASVRWDFAAGQPGTQATLAIPNQRDFDGLAVWVKNPDELALQLAPRLTDAQGRTWVAPPVALQLQRGWYRYVFRVSDFEGLPGALPPPPYGAVELTVSGLEAGKTYRLYLDELTVLRAPPPALQAGNLVAAREAQAGKALPVQVRVQGDRQTARPVPFELQLLRGETPVSVLRAPVAVTTQPRTETLALPIPRHIVAGAYKVRLTWPGATPAQRPELEVTVQAPAAPAKISVRNARNGGCFVVDDQPLPLLGGWLRGEAMPAEAPWVMVPCTSDFDPTGESGIVWKGPQEFDYRELDARLAATLAANPGAYIIPVVHVSSPPWWDKEHPKELMVFGDGKTVLPDSVQWGKRTCASWASEVWRKDAGAALTRLIQHLEDGPWGPAIIGYQLAAGEDGRWVYPGASQGVFSDYSHPQHEAFRAWLKNKYRDTRSLRMAWGQPGQPVNSPEALKEFQPITGWSQARVPGQTERLRAPSGVLHDPTAAQEIVDYQTFSSDLVAETIRYFASLARQATGERKVVGVAYGQIFDLAGTRCGAQNGGHLALVPVCEAPELDFVVAPAAAGEAGLPVMSTVAASLAEHGKLWVATAAARLGSGAVAGALCSGAAVAEEGSGGVAATRLRKFAGIGRGSISEVAVVVDDISLAYTAAGSDLVKPLLSDQRVGLSLIGAPVDVWTLDDVMSGRAPGYKLYIMLDAFYLDAASRKQLQAALAQQPCTALWVYAPGAIDESIGGRTMRELTGLTLVQRYEKGPLQVKVTGDGYTYGPAAPLTPRFVCVDDKADVLGMLVGTPYGGLASGQMGKTKNVWSGATHLPASLLRSIALDADVHLWTEAGDAVYVRENVLALRAGQDGEHVVRLPQLAQVYDLETGQAVGPRSSEFRVRLKQGEVRMYYWGSGPLPQ